MKKEKYGEVIRIARIANDSSVKELAQAVGKSSSYLLNYAIYLLIYAIKMQKYK